MNVRLGLGATLATAVVAGAWGGDVAAQSAPMEGDQVYQSGRHSFRIVTVVPELENPWSMAWLPNGDMLVTERAGRLRLVRGDVLDPEPIAGTPEVRAQGQGGLLDVLLHPDFASNQLIYLSFAKPSADSSEATTAVVRGRLEGHGLADVEEIFVAQAWRSGNAHFSGRMAFDLEGRHLFLSVGDRGEDPDLLANQPAQDPSNHQGTILRLNPDGSVPADNPFVGQSGFRPEIWSYGHRNAQGLAIHPETGEVWANEHGPRGGDEVNVSRPGRNYGWPVASYGINYDGTIYTEVRAAEGMESPLHVWIPSIAPSGMLIYTGDQFPWWKGSVFVGGLAAEQLSRLTFEGYRAVSEETLLKGELGRIRDVRQGPDGYIYLTTDGRGGLNTPVLRLEPVESDIETPTG